MLNIQSAVLLSALLISSLCFATDTHHENLIKALRQSSEVIPPMPKDVHPLKTVYNREAIIPSMCYTKTEGTHNPCYVCHQDPVKGRENKMRDGELQTAYSFSDLGLKNHWNNLFEDRSDRIAKISDKAIIEWINQDNYSELAPKLEQAGFKGWIPDLKDLEKGAKAFASNGIAKDGSHWVAFNYKPFPSTFWPTNGNTDDVMIRLDTPYRENQNGKYSKDVYLANLSIVEANIKGLKEIDTFPINEKRVGKDLNGDGKLGKVTRITQLKGYVGGAEKYYFETGIYPEKTEFLHTVRYLGISPDGDITVSTRMKEVRYMKKWRAFPKVALAQYYREEAYEKEAGNLPGYTSVHDWGLDNGMGWSIQGYIEGKDGQLRNSTFEENMFCMGCHNSIGSTIDKTFSFGRKIDGKKGWGYINLKDMQDAPNIGESQGEILTYFERVGGGGEFRSNEEMEQRWFNSDGSVNREKVLAAKDVYELIVPSVERALELNKAYRIIVEDQDYIFGRDTTASPPKNVYKSVDNRTSPTLPEDKFYSWDLRLDWNTNPAE